MGGEEKENKKRDTKSQTREKKMSHGKHSSLRAKREADDTIV